MVDLNKFLLVCHLSICLSCLTFCKLLNGAMEFIFVETCPGARVSLEGRQGVFISGTIQPAIKGVRIVITSEERETTKVEVETGEKGDYRWVDVDYRWVDVDYRWVDVDYRWVDVDYRWVDVHLWFTYFCVNLLI